VGVMSCAEVERLGGVGGELGETGRSVSGLVLGRGSEIALPAGSARWNDPDVERRRVMRQLDRWLAVESWERGEAGKFSRSRSDCQIPCAWAALTQLFRPGCRQAHKHVRPQPTVKRALFN
jgi:hypothetical protein